MINPLLGPRPYLKPKPQEFPRPKSLRPPRKGKVTIAIHLAGDGFLLTASDTQESYSTREKVDSGKIISFGRSEPLGCISVTGAGDAIYIDALSQDIVRSFKNFKGSVDGLEQRIRHVIRAFYNVHILHFVGKLQYDNLPYYSLLIAVTHRGFRKLWSVDETMLSESAEFDCVGIGEALATSMLNRLYPRYTTLDSLAILAAYVIYRVKGSVDGCGLKRNPIYAPKHICNRICSCGAY